MHVTGAVERRGMRNTEKKAAINTSKALTPSQKLARFPISVI